MSRIILFGLGNPGTSYEWTPHNLGFHVVDSLAAMHRVRWNRFARTHDYADFQTGETHVFLVKPTTYVNVAGRGLRDFLRDTDIEPSELLVVVDDIALPSGQLRLRRRGSHGGHNGLRSIASELGTDRFARLRMGVGPVAVNVDPADFVLSRFASRQRDGVKEFVGRAVRCIEDVVEHGFDRAMTVHNVADRESD
jgi:PTH1 family peptidyl-tRNA hydrolase